MKRLIILFVALLLVACSSSEDEPISQRNPDNEETQEINETTDNQEKQKEKESEGSTTPEEAEENEGEVTLDDVKNQDNIIGKSDKDFSEITNSKPSDVRNDTTGNWKVITISENVDIEEYALSYYNTHMEDGEVHHIVNFTRNTTTWLNHLGGLLYVDVKERVEREEHDASILGSGMLLKSYVIYSDGDIEEIE